MALSIYRIFSKSWIAILLKLLPSIVLRITPILKSLHWLKVSARIEYNIISLTYKILSTNHQTYLWPCIYSASLRSQHTLFTLCYSDHIIIITRSHSSLLPTCFISSLEPASYITQNSSSELLIPLSATFIWTCQFNLLHTAITFSLFHSELKTYLFLENLILHLSLFLSVTAGYNFCRFVEHIGPHKI